MKNWKQLKQSLVSNWLLKLASLLIAFALWFVVIIIDNPVSDKSFTNIQVNLVNTELVTDNGMVYEVLDNSDVLKRVSFDAPKSIRDVIQPSDIIAEADFENLTATNTVAITYSCPKYSADVTDISGNISNVKLNIENKKSKWLNIEYNVIGDVAEGFLIGGISLDQNRLEIVGPESKIDTISNAVIDVNVAGIYSNISSRADVKLLTIEGEEAAYASVTNNVESVKVTVDVLATKEIPVQYMAMGVPAEGYIATGVVEGSPNAVLIAGSQNVLKNVNSITIPAEEINMTGATANYEQMVDLEKYLPNGVIFGDSSFDGNAKVVVYIEKIAQKEIPVDTTRIRIDNIPEYFVAEVLPAEGLTLKVQGLQNDLVNVRESTIQGVVDLAAYAQEQGMGELVEGNYAIEVDFGLDEAYKQVEPVVVNVIVTGPLEEG